MVKSDTELPGFWQGEDASSAVRNCAVVCGFLRAGLLVIDVAETFGQEGRAATGRLILHKTAARALGRALLGITSTARMIPGTAPDADCFLLATPAEM